MPRFDSIPCECTCHECGAVCAPDKRSRMCAQCQNRMHRTIQRGVYNNPKHWPPDWIAKLLDVPLLGLEPLEPPKGMREFFDLETSAMAQRLEAEEPEEDPDRIDPEDYAPMYGEHPYPEGDKGDPAYVSVRWEVIASIPLLSRIVVVHLTITF